MAAKIQPYSRELIQHTQEIWAKHLGHKISEQEAVQVIRTFSEFLTLLKEIKQNGK